MPKIFGRKEVVGDPVEIRETSAPVLDAGEEASPHDLSEPADTLDARPTERDDDFDEVTERAGTMETHQAALADAVDLPPLAHVPEPEQDAPFAPEVDLPSDPPEFAPFTGTGILDAGATLASPALDELSAAADFPPANESFSMAPADMRADLAPVSDTAEPVANHLSDEETIAIAAVDALRSVGELLLSRVERIRKLSDNTRIMSDLIALIGELDSRYAADTGLVRRTGLEDVLAQVREAVPEDDRFILESLENGRGGLSSDDFARDLRTIAASDRPRVVAEYTAFLVFILRYVLRQYLLPLQAHKAALRDMTKRLDYLIDGVRDVLLARVKENASRA